MNVCVRMLILSHDAALFCCQNPLWFIVPTTWMICSLMMFPDDLSHVQNILRGFLYTFIKNSRWNPFYLITLKRVPFPQSLYKLEPSSGAQPWLKPRHFTPNFSKEYISYICFKYASQYSYCHRFPEVLKTSLSPEILNPIFH